MGLVSAPAPLLVAFAILFGGPLLGIALIYFQRWRRSRHDR